MKRTQTWPSPGNVVSVPAYIIFRHKGIVSDRWYGGKPMVISNSARAGAMGGRHLIPASARVIAAAPY